MNTTLDLISILQSDLDAKKLKNSKYSLRAAARDLGMQPAILSGLLKRKRALTNSYKKKIYAFLRLTNEQIAVLESHKTQNVPFNQLDVEIIRSISDWYHDAITELLRTKGIEFNADFIAKRLNINLEEAEVAIERLQALNIIKVLKNKAWSVSFDNTLIYGGDSTNFALQTLQRQLLEKAIEALVKVPKTDREQASMTMAINKKDLPEAKKRIKEFHQSLCEYLQRPNRESDEVFQLITSFFPLSQ
jgi:uncharacterized protein (TIGR02147 family)